MRTKNREFVESWLLNTKIQRPAILRRITTIWDRPMNWDA